ncbi:hypothetical protein KBZ18_10215 [Synechococcus sp. Cruz-9H2]|uniref:hypothetical protein n=1 Tax=unclassified Synechococcus TaxID=2626047 RepID=UPI0020CE8611|nr:MULTISPECIES: hypothetical protein [unclassified Synechococcus]MCP9819867.1 hypothetical protein [Synechococcus sp. Cruz-9H2]MCP9863582.1 hypothetical protein [Synechococcus sp. Cruz-7E5]MCP9844067.1 hypothetical protein [Synechococcus sp. Edmonson 11F2]MCP9856297.1 hypothetical protein [Synechococcus sp. Cruz-9C9]MCP9870778.1 hypothetical protein [Synechococcus sp. Cruz-7B9]
MLQKGLLEPGDLDEARATFAAVGDHEMYHHDHHGTPVEHRQSFQEGYLQGFRRSGEYAANQPQSPAQSSAAPQQPSTQKQPLKPAAPSSFLPVLGLGLGALLVLVIGGMFTLVNRAKGDDI